MKTLNAEMHTLCPLLFPRRPHQALLMTLPWSGVQSSDVDSRKYTIRLYPSLVPEVRSTVIEDSDANAVVEPPAPVMAMAVEPQLPAV